MANKNNLEVNRLISYFPKWSFAFRNHYSKLTKLIFPLYDSILSSQSRIVHIAACAIKNSEHTFEFKNKSLYRYISPYVDGYQKATSINTSDGVFENIGQLTDSWYDDYPVGAVKLMPCNQKTIASIACSPDSYFEPLVLGSESFLYVSGAKGTINIFGLDANGDQVSEKIEVTNKDVSFMTLNRYKIIVDVDTDSEVMLSQLCSTMSYKSKFVDYKRVADNTGSYFEPVFELDGRSITVTNNGNTVYELELDSDYVDGKIFVTESLDIVFLTEDGSLKTAKPGIDLSLLNSANATYNNNGLVSINVEHISAGTTVVFTLNRKNIEALNSAFCLSIVDNGVESFVDIHGNIVDERIYYPPSAINSKKDIPYYSASKNIAMKLQVANIPVPFMAGTADNTIISSTVLNGVDDIFIYDGKIVVVMFDSAYTIFNTNNILVNEDGVTILEIQDTNPQSKHFFLYPVRQCYLHDSQYIYTESPIEIL